MINLNVFKARWRKHNPWEHAMNSETAGTVKSGRDCVHNKLSMSHTHLRIHMHMSWKPFRHTLRHLHMPLILLVVLQLICSFIYLRESAPPTTQSNSVPRGMVEIGVETHFPQKTYMIIVLVQEMWMSFCGNSGLYFNWLVPCVVDHLFCSKVKKGSIWNRTEQNHLDFKNGPFFGKEDMII